jgi:hypothetical protein
MSASRVRTPRMTSAPQISSTNGIITPTVQSDQTGRNVSLNGRKYLRACSTGPHLKDLHCAGHEKDETQNQTTKQNRAGPLKMLIHKRFGSCQIKAGLRKPELKKSDCEIRHISESDHSCQFSISSLNNSRSLLLQLSMHDDRQHSGTGSQVAFPDSTSAFRLHSSRWQSATLFSMSTCDLL